MAFNTGTSHGLEAYFFKHGLNRKANFRKPVELREGIDPRNYFEVLQDFHGDAGDTPEIPWNLNDRVSTTGSQTVDFVTDVPDGIVQLKHTSNDQVEQASIDTSDHLWINLSKKPIVTFRVKINYTSNSGFATADQRAVFGVGSNYASTLNNVTTNAWFRVDGADDDLDIETDDGTNDNSTDSESDLADDTWAILQIDFADLADVKFYKDGVRQLSGSTFDMSNLSADTKVQPLIVLQKDEGSEQPDLRCDFVHVVQERT